MDQRERRSRGYAGYDLRDVPREDTELTHVGPGTPCGEYLRRVWQPVAMSSELRDLPVPVRVLGEDLVAFRDGAGRVGVLHRHCAHRGASLEFGIPMERGIKCCYHGWHYDVDGTLIDLPGEPPSSPARRIVQGAYPAREHAGLVFAYLGPPGTAPPFPVLDTYGRTGVEAVPFSLSAPCNWLQVYENTQDPAHVLHLHARSSGVQFGVASGVDQIVEYRETPLGMMNVQTRRCGPHLWCRTVDTILPNCNQTGAIWEEADRPKWFQRVSMTRWMVPVDDTHTVTLGWRYFDDETEPPGTADRSLVGKESIDFVGQTGGRDYEARQREPGDYDAQVSQRPIAVHALEHRVESDRGVVMLRRLVREGIRRLARGERLAGYPASPVPTYCQDTVHPVAPTAGDEAPRRRDFGRAVADAVLASAGLDHEDRAAAVRRACEAWTAR